MYLPKCVVPLKNLGKKNLQASGSPSAWALLPVYFIALLKEKKIWNVKYPEFEVFLNDESTSYWKHWSDEKLVQALKAVTNSYIHFHA